MSENFAMDLTEAEKDGFLGALNLQLIETNDALIAALAEGDEWERTATGLLVAYNACTEDKAAAEADRDEAERKEQLWRAEWEQITETAHVIEAKLAKATAVLSEIFAKCNDDHWTNAKAIQWICERIANYHAGPAETAGEGDGLRHSSAETSGGGGQAPTSSSPAIARPAETETPGGGA